MNLEDELVQAQYRLASFAQEALSSSVQQQCNVVQRAGIPLTRPRWETLVDSDTDSSNGTLPPGSVQEGSASLPPLV